MLEAEQFLASNIYELSSFKTANLRITIEKLAQRYNEIIEKCETDPSLRLVLG